MQRFGRENFIVGEKIGVVRGEDGSWKGGNGSRDYLRKSIDTALRRLQTNYIDLVYFNRTDPNTPIEDTVRNFIEYSSLDCGACRDGEGRKDQVFGTVGSWLGCHSKST